MKSSRTVLTLILVALWPLATVVIGGVLSSTLLTLVLLPVLYEWLEAGSSRTGAQTSSVR